MHRIHIVAKLAGAGAAAIGGVALLMGPAIPALAGNGGDNIGVSATVNNVASVTAGSLDFGNYDPIIANGSDPKAGSATISVDATTGSTYTIALDSGQNATSSQRRLTDGSSNYLDYDLYSDSNHQDAWDNTTSRSGSGSSQDYTVYGQIPAAQNVPAGSYSDTVAVTVAFS